MATLPAVSRTLCSRINQPYENTTTQLNLARSVMFSLIQNLINTAAGGTLTGTRHANSVWAVLGSSDGSTNFSTAGVNHIAARTNLIWAANGANHSWIWLENTTLGYQIVLDCINATETDIRLSASRTASAAYTGGSLTQAPTSTEEFFWATTSIGFTSVSYLSDLTTGGTQNTHFVVAENGEFEFMASRAGTGVCHLFIGLQRTVGGPVGDVRNTFWIGATSTSGRGVPTGPQLSQVTSGIVGRNPNGVAVVTQGGGSDHSAGGTVLFGGGNYGTDAVSGQYNSTAVSVWSANAGQYAYRGTLPDMYTITSVNIGTSIPSAAAQTRTVVGDYIIAFPSTVAMVV